MNNRVNLPRNPVAKHLYTFNLPCTMKDKKKAALSQSLQRRNTDG